MEDHDDKLGQRRTSQRDAIQQVIVDSDGPLTVDDIHARAAAAVGTLGIATVYRTVKLLMTEGRIHSVSLPDQPLRYEQADLGHHHHFQCRGCGQVYDLEECPMALPKNRELAGFLVEDHDVTLYGRCPQCH